MVMDFVGDQDRARARTGRLVVLFLAALVGISLIVHLMVTATLMVLAHEDGIAIGWFDPIILLFSAGGTLLLVVGASLFKTAQLSSGGKAVAQALGGRLVHPDERDPSLRRLLNVVEEMAIASGCPVPPVYVIDDASINAFAAGFTFDSAVIGVTHGCVEKLSRDELQGVMAHEFSHIVNGDMRLNIRLTGLIFGIMVLGFIGWICVRFIAPSVGGSGGRGGGKNGGQIGLAFLVVGIGLMIVGSVGTLVARLIQASVSRQREFLADAAAVDYTRNPKGIADALRTIGGLPKNQMERSAASEFEHFFFTPALATAFATHPPLPMRIARIENRPISEVQVEYTGMKRQIGAERAARMSAGLPADGSADPVPPPPSKAAAAPPLAAGVAIGVAAAASGHAPNWRTRGAQEVRESLSHLGDASADHLAYARNMLAAIPEKLRDAARDAIGAEAICLLLLVSPEPEVRKAQATILQEKVAPEVAAEINRLHGSVRKTVADAPELRLVLADLVMPALARLEEDAATAFLASVKSMQDADGRLDRFEWLLGRLLQSHFGSLMGRRRGSGSANRTLRVLSEEGRLVLAMIAWSGARNASQARAAFRAAAQSASLGDADFPDRSDCSVMVLDRALDRLQRLRFRDRATLLDAAVEAVCADGHATIEEVELLRALAAAIQCPMPPVLPSVA